MKKSPILALIAFCAGAIYYPLPQAKAEPNKPALARQTAKPWTGDPLEFEYPNREKTIKIETVYSELKIGKGSVVADVGAGGGWLSTRLARKVGPTGIVYAEEILLKYVQFLQNRAKIEKLPQIKTVLGTTSDPKLPTGLDAVIILNAYHEFDQPIEMLKKIRGSMKPSARLGFIERDTGWLRDQAETAFKKTGKIKRQIQEVPDNNPFTDDHRLAMNVVKREAELAGFRSLSAIELGGDHYLLVVERPRQ